MSSLSVVLLLCHAGQITAQLAWQKEGEPINSYDATGFLLGNLVGSADTTRVGMFHTMALLAMSDRVRGQVVEEQTQVRIGNS